MNAFDLYLSHLIRNVDVSFVIQLIYQQNESELFGAMVLLINHLCCRNCLIIAETFHRGSDWLRRKTTCLFSEPRGKPICLLQNNFQANNSNLRRMCVCLCIRSSNTVYAKQKEIKHTHRFIKRV